MMETKGNWQTPRAVIHKRILDTAQDRPDASMRELADDIAAASVDLVEKVLDEYGDPSEEPTDLIEARQGQVMEEPKTELTDEESGIETANQPKLSEFSEDQREVLREIYEAPTAPQRKIGEALGISAATVCNRLQEIPGFAWADRQEFVEGLFGAQVRGDGVGRADRETPPDIEERLDQVERQLHTIESPSQSPVLATELAHKVLHAGMNSDQISEDEELELIRALFGDPTKTSQQ